MDNKQHEPSPTKRHVSEQERHETSEQKRHETAEQKRHETAESKYYEAYEQRYRLVYGQGIEYWSNHPAEVKEEVEGLEAFLNFCGADPAADRVLEPGCGEGNLAVLLTGKGFRYVGVDLAPSAIEKARLRLERAGLSGLTEFVLADATELSFLPEAEFDLAVDNKFLHMLVVDGDRERYLAGLRRALKSGAWAMFNELYLEDAYSGPVTSFEQYMDIFSPDLSTMEERAAYNGDTPVTVRIPKLPGRFKNEAGYRSEMERAGFEVVRFEVLQSYMGCRFFARAMQHARSL
ncbi:MAG: class I SAM-dependent methyltransferase [Bacillota bacterium]